jgi:hypothetical protein
MKCPPLRNNTRAANPSPYLPLELLFIRITNYKQISAFGSKALANITLSVTSVCSDLFTRIFSIINKVLMISLRASSIVQSDI